VHALILVFVLASLPLSIVGIAAHAAHARQDELVSRPSRVAAVRRMPSADFAFAGGSRHLRFLTLEEPQAAFADGPGLPDPDPAGGLIGVPKAAYADAVTRAGTGTKKGTP
jgi:hypothetical protein